MHAVRRRWLELLHVLPVPRVLAGVAGLAAAMVLFAGCEAVPAPAEMPSAHIPAMADAADPKLQAYLDQVKPILQANCLRCHGGMNRRGGLNMSTRALLLQGGKDGVVVIPGRPEDSLLVKVISPGMAADDPMRMPLKGNLSPAEIATLRKWVADGVVMDR